MVPFSVAPSAAAWLAARDRTEISAGAPVLVVAGPGLGHAGAEAAAVAAVYRTPVVLTGEQATVQQVLLHLDQSDVAHVACHGSFRADNPQFSSLRLADGPLSTHDLSGIGHYPLLCVLSACDVGLADASGAGALGVAASLLGGGSSAVLASVLPADDARTPSLMADFHRRLAAGEPAAVALCGARQVLDDRPVACGFTLYGASVRFRLVD
jgi:CHAT domain-containing protein